MSGAENPDMATSTRPPLRLNAVPESRGLRAAPGSWLRIDPQEPLPLAGQPGHGSTASLRRQSTWVADEREGRRTGLFEIICRDCGDHPYLDYEGIPPRLQQIRGPYPLEAGLAAYAEHVGLSEAAPGQAGAGEATMSSGTGDPDVATRPRPATPSGAVPAPRRPDSTRDSWRPADAGSAVALPPPGRPGHGRTARLRRQPFSLLDGRARGRYTDAFEVICPSCGDNPDLDYAEVPAWLQRLRGPHPLNEGLAAYLEHIGG
jgi:hypothetical protein